jgi:hypothetical protein
MFALSDADLGTLNILGCADGPASFNAEATRRGDSVISCDPIYQFNVIEVRARISETYDQIIEQTRKNMNQFVWTTIKSVEDLGHMRMEAMRMFLDDYEMGKEEGRYVEASLPSLPFVDGEFDLALCSHFLFLYSTQLGKDFHRAAIRELCRVRCACSRCWPSAVSPRHTSSSLPEKRVPQDTRSSSSLSRTNFNVARTG